MSAEQKLVSRILQPDISDDPEAFVMFAFPWGKKGTPLEDHEGPREWQRKVLVELKEHIHAMREHDYAKAKEKFEVFKKAIAAGRGIGKSALIAWIIYWFISTRIGGTVIVSANTKDQLEGVTWGELGKWFPLLINNHWFEITATAIKPATWFDKVVREQLKRGTRYYYVDAKLWSEENPSAYAGVHNPFGLLLVFDEASGIADGIWPVASGFFTDPIKDRYWLAFSNPRIPHGEFFECFHKKRKLWSVTQIDPRTVEGTDRKFYDGLIEEYGEDSDEARIEAMGLFPNRSNDGFIASDVVHAAAERELVEDKTAPLLMGVDVARFGDDESVIRFRRGRDARSKKPIRFKGVDTMALATHVANLIERESPDAVFVDGGGVGGGVVDRLKQLGYKVIEVQSGEKANAADKYLNKRAEMWAELRVWLKTGCIKDENGLIEDLIGPKYMITPKGQVKLESKEDMKKRGLASPDDADSLALTFAYPVGYKSDLSGEPIRRKDILSGLGRVFGGGSRDGNWMH